ncbi:MAG: PLD nuclease N-terminal domain-containing protein [Nocardioidaceae bacterium]|nr:PLD nuclease N-terminal domain-containing protein [Nocardioidaceae bacterium]
MTTSPMSTDPQTIVAALDADQASGTIGIVLGAGIAAALAALVVLFVAAIVSILRSDGLSGGQKLGWTVVVLFLQLVGPVLWFTVGRRLARDQVAAPR